MNRTQRAMIRSCKEAAESSRRQKNDTIARRNGLIKKAKGETGYDKSLSNHNIVHLSCCIKKDRENEKALLSDAVVYKKRFAAAKKSAKEFSVE